jgi:hypothetical protein
MNEAVVLLEDGGKATGHYDGYGRLYDGSSCYEDGEPMDEGLFLGDHEVWHRACWRLAGKPKFTKASSHAGDQGYFVGEYDPPEPKTLADMKALKAEGERLDAERRQAWAEALKSRHEAKSKES